MGIIREHPQNVSFGNRHGRWGITLLEALYSAFSRQWRIQHFTGRETELGRAKSNFLSTRNDFQYKKRYKNYRNSYTILHFVYHTLPL